MSTSKRSLARRLLPLALRVGVSAGILTWLASRTDWAQVGAAFRGLRWGYWAAAAGLYGICQWLCCVRWFWLSRPLGFDHSVARFTGIYFVGMFFNLFLPTSVGGDAVRAVYLVNGSGRRLNALLSVLLDRASGLVVLVGLACAAAALSPIELPAQLRLIVYSAGAATLLGMAGLALVTRLAARLRDDQFDVVRRIANSTDRAVALFRARPGLLAGTTGLSFAVQVLNAVLVWLIGLSLRLDVPPSYYGVIAPMVTLFTLIPISLNGMGLREGAMVLFLAPAGASSADAVSLAFLWFLVQTTTSLLGAIVYLSGRLTPLEGDAGERAAVSRDSGQGRAGQRRAAA